MNMHILAKIGTGPQQQVKVIRKRKEPELRERINIVCEGYNSNRPISCIVSDIKNIHGYKLYYLEMM